MMGERYFRWLLLCNLVIAVVYLFVGLFLVVPMRKLKSVREQEEYRRDGRKVVFIRFLVMLLCPAVGIVYFVVERLLQMTVFRKKVDLADVMFSKERVKEYEKVDEELQRTLTPLEEGLAVTDRKNMRLLMLNVVKTDIRKSLSSIAQALDSDDSETSHYAAAVLQGIMNDFIVNVQKLRNMAEEEDEGETDCEEQLIEYMDSVLDHHIFSGFEQKRFVKILDETTEKLFEKKSEAVTPEMQERICMKLMDIDDYDTAWKWCERMEVYYPETLGNYRCRLRFFYEKGEREAFFDSLNRLKASNILIDQEMLEMIKTF